MHDIQEHHNDDEQLPKMDELLSKMMHLSAHIKNKSESTSSTEGTSAKHKLSLKKVARKKQKSQKHQRGKKRSSKHINDFEFDSSSFTDCTDEEVLKDYIENLTANCSDSDAENSIFKKSAFLAKRDLASIQHFCIPFHGNKTESYNDSMCFPPSRKKRKKYKRHYIDGTYKLLNGQMTRKQRDKIHNVISNQYKRTSSCAFNGSCRKKYELEEYSHEEEMDFESDKSFNISSNKKVLKQGDRETKKKVIDESMELPDSENSDSSVGSPCLEADDEGEETCHEVTIIPWWEKNTENSDNDMMELTQNISKGDMASRLQKIGPLKVVSESGGFIAYANHKMKSFVHQRDITELSLFTTNKKEEKQVILLASLYNLQTSAENFGRCNKVVFTKTLTTKDADQSALKSFLSREVKLRCRKNRSSFQQTSKRHKLSSESVKHENDCTDIIDIPIPECNMGNKMLQTMGWSPGQGLGKKSDGIINPVKAIKRPRNLGFGHPYS